MHDKKKMMKDEPSDAHYDAKMAVLEELRELAMELMKGKMGDKLGGLKEVTVAAPDEKGMEEGLDMAQQMLSEEMTEDDEDEDEEDEA